MKTAEDLLVDELCFGHLHSGKNSDRLHIPSIWELAHDLDKYIKDGLLVETPITCSLADILEAERYFYKRNAPYLRLLESDYMGRTEKTEFRTVPGGTVYRLEFTKGDRTPISGHFSKVIDSTS